LWRTNESRRIRYYPLLAKLAGIPVGELFKVLSDIYIKTVLETLLDGERVNCVSVFTGQLGYFDPVGSVTPIKGTFLEDHFEP